MSTRRRFRPTSLEPLEPRIALSQALGGLPAIVAPPRQTRQERAGLPPRVYSGINQAFDAFKQDFFEAQGVYLASGTPMQNFMDFTRQRVLLLSQQLAPLLGHLPGAINLLPSKQRMELRSNRIDTPLQAFLARRITGPDANGPDMPLVKSLNQNVPPPGTSGPASTLYTLTETSAIENARVNTFNAARFLLTGKFSPKHGH
jgi:hypothetical protein